MPAWLYDAGPHGLWIFLLVTVALGGAAAFVTGRSLAETWRPTWQIPAYMLILACAVRFVQMAVFEAKLLAVNNYIIDFVVLLSLCVAGFFTARQRQMREQYGWLPTKPGA